MGRLTAPGAQQAPALPIMRTLVIVPQGRLELPRNLIHQILSLTRINHFRHTGIIAREGLEPSRYFYQQCLRLSCLHSITWRDNIIVTEGLEPSRYFYHKTLILARLPITPHDVYIFIGTGRLALPIPFGHGPLKPACIHSITYRYIGLEGLEPTRWHPSD